jgi:hypothetical protein
MVPRTRQYVRVWLSVAVTIHDGGVGGESEAHIVVAGSAAVGQINFLSPSCVLRN